MDNGNVLRLESGVNITVGLPIIQTGVDQGTAFVWPEKELLVKKA